MVDRILMDDFPNQIWPGGGFLLDRHCEHSYHDPRKEDWHLICTLPPAVLDHSEVASVNDSPLSPNLQKPSDSFAKIWADEETLVADGRSQLTPSQHVEQKLIGMLKASPLMVSHVQRRLKPGPR